MESTPSSRQEMAGSPRGFYFHFGKRILDVLLAATAFLVVAPVLLVCAMAIYLDSRGSIFYSQWRVGRNAVPFRIIKLRTMVKGADGQGPRLTASGDPRITRVGRILRCAKLDELPQLLNVLRGEMSLVGPRPELPEYVSKYTLSERMIFDVKPGITGPASVTYIDEESVLAERSNREEFYVNHLMREKLDVDLAYCRTLSFSSDLKIILQTATSLFNAFRRKQSRVSQGRLKETHGIETSGHVTNNSECGLSFIEEASEKGTRPEFGIKA
jgi:lipopolysaccharide/colanic/teichoic acid biosynthesis glycosyltransferase